MTKWSCPAVSKILDLPEGQEVAVLGTIYKEMKLKPSILSEYNKVTEQACCKC
jgi:DNA polymerase delta subunit 2